MKIQLRDLINIADEKVYPADIQRYAVADNVFLRRLENVKGDIVFYYDASDELRINYHLEGTMICPCAISLEDVSVPFDLSEDEKVVHKENEDGFYFYEDKNNINEIIINNLGFVYENEKNNAYNDDKSLKYNCAIITYGI